jgi:hypothetical protein
MKSKKRFLTDALLAVATVGVVAGTVWANDTVDCPEKVIGGFTIPAFTCPAGERCAYVAVYGENGDLLGVAGACLGSPEPLPD